MITIVRVKAKGFLSIIQKVKYKYERPGVNIITGKNGAGKTTLFNILFWSLYGQTLKPGTDVEPWEHILHGYKDGLMALTEFQKDGKDYQVIRCKNYRGKFNGQRGGNRLYLYEGETLFEGKHKADVQRRIIEILGYSPNLFKASILFGQELKRLMEEDGPQKKKILEEAFEASYISKAKELVDKRLVHKNNEALELEGPYQLAKSDYKNAKRNYLEQKELLKKLEAQKAEDIRSIEKEIKTLEKQNARLQETLDKLPKLKHRLEINKQRVDEYLPDSQVANDEFKLEFNYLGAQEKVDQLDGTLTALKQKFQNMPRTCEVCKQPIGPHLIKKQTIEIKKEITRTKAKKEEAIIYAASLKKKWKGAKDRLSSIEQEKKTWEDIRKEVNRLEMEINDAAHFSKEVLAKTKKAQQLRKKKDQIWNRENLINLPALLKQKKEAKAAMIARREEYREIKNKIALDKWLVNEPLSNSGLKAYIFDTMIQKLNHYLKRYATYIGFKLEVFIDMKRANKDVSINVIKNSHTVDYRELSKGQKQLANVALIFALNDTVTESKPINIIIADEVFESLSKENVEIVGSIIQKKAMGKSIHIITHHGDFNPVNSYKTEVKLNELDQTVIHQKFKDM